MSFLLIRPQHKLALSCARFNDAGLKVNGLALITTHTNNLAEKTLKQALTYDKKQNICIVVSTVAAEIVCDGIQQWPTNLLCIAVGQSTADILRRIGASPLVPDIATTEGVLALPALSQLADKTCYLCKGKGGREDLAKELSIRGARIEEFELYTRLEIESTTVNRDWQQAQISCIIVTSGEQIELAFAKLNQSWLQTMPWIVVSERTAKIAAKLGVKQVFISAGASDEQLIATAKKFLER